MTRYTAHGGNRLPTKKQIKGLDSIPEFTDFTDQLELYHNVVHMYAGGVSGNSVGTMGNITISPADPLFWMHHANIDRIWAHWPQSQAQLPNPSPPANVLDPWKETVAQLKDIASIAGHAYSYA